MLAGPALKLLVPPVTMGYDTPYGGKRLKIL